MKRTLTAEDFVFLDVYAAQRAQRRRAIIALKTHRRVEVGPCASFYFENDETIRHQIQEMLFVEGGGKKQLEEELAAYNPLIPQGQELVATLMFEIDDEKKRLAFLRALGGVEKTVFLQVAEHKTQAYAEDDVSRTTPDGKTSSIHFLHFPLSQNQRKQWTTAEIILGIKHKNYTHQTKLSSKTVAALKKDFEV